MNVRARRLSFRRIGDVSALYRITAAVQANRKPFPLVIDIALVGTGRTELGLTTTGPGQAANALGVFEVRELRKLAARATA